MLHAKNVPLRFSAECVKLAVYVNNRVSQNQAWANSLYEKLWGTKPLVTYFQVFEYVCYVFILG